MFGPWEDTSKQVESIYLTEYGENAVSLLINTSSRWVDYDVRVKEGILSVEFEKGFPREEDFEVIALEKLGTLTIPIPQGWKDLCHMQEKDQITVILGYRTRGYSLERK